MRWPLLVSVLALCAGGIVWQQQASVREEPVVLETSHIPVLEPHEHDEGDSVNDAGHHEYAESPVFVVPHDMWVSAISFELHNAPDATLHHAALLRLDHPHQTCSQIPMEELAGFAQDSMHAPTISFPRGSAMHLSQGDRLELIIMEHNPLPPVGPGGTYEDVYGRMTLTPHDGPLDDLKPIRFHLMHLDEVPCDVTYSDGTAAFMFSVPPHTKDFEMKSTAAAGDPSVYTFQSSSTIVYIGGHLHGWEGGKKLFVSKGGLPFLEFVSRPSPDTPYRFDSQYYPTHLDMSPGDTLTLRALYDNPGDEPIPDAMGILEMYFYED